MENKKYWCPSHPEVQSNDSSAICTKCGTMILISNPHYEGSDVGVSNNVVVKRNLKDFLPLIVIFGVIILFTTLMTVFVRTEVGFAMQMMMGSFFAIFGAFKIFNLKPFADAYTTYDVIAMRYRTYAFIYPFLEILLAVLYFSNIGGIYRDTFTFMLMFVSSIGVIIKLQKKEEIPCACLGMVFKLPMTWVTLVEDVLMGVEALIMIGLSFYY